jgi:hypothetical protein
MVAAAVVRQFPVIQPQLFHQQHPRGESFHHVHPSAELNSPAIAAEVMMAAAVVRQSPVIQPQPFHQQRLRTRMASLLLHLRRATHNRLWYLRQPLTIYINCWIASLAGAANVHSPLMYNPFCVYPYLYPVNSAFYSRTFPVQYILSLWAPL